MQSQPWQKIEQKYLAKEKNEIDKKINNLV